MVQLYPFKAFMTIMSNSFTFKDGLPDVQGCETRSSCWLIIHSTILVPFRSRLNQPEIDVRLTELLGHNDVVCSLSPSHRDYKVLGLCKFMFIRLFPFYLMSKTHFPIPFPFSL